MYYASVGDNKDIKVLHMEKFKHKKSLGQNFLKDEQILKQIADAIETSEIDTIIEIGPGQGALTKHLVQKPGFLFCYEIDERVKQWLEPLESDTTKVIWKDFLQVEIKEDIKANPKGKLYFIANLPYYITTPIIEKIIASKVGVEAMVFMVQKEVADRFSAKEGSKEYGSLTVYLNYYYEIEKLFNVSKTCFDPVPNVDSAVVKFTKRKEAFQVENEDFFFQFVQDAFHLKRKNLRNNLTQYDLAKIEEILARHGLSLQSRAEQIPMEVFIELANKLWNT